MIRDTTSAGAALVNLTASKRSIAKRLIFEIVTSPKHEALFYGVKDKVVCTGS